MSHDNNQMMLSNERTCNYINNSYNSMNYHICPNSSVSLEISNTSNCNTSNYCYQPNINNIHLNWMRNFPFARVDQCDLKGNNRNHNTENSNKTFMMTSFDHINSNLSENNMNTNSISRKKENCRLDKEKSKFLNQNIVYNNLNNRNIMDKESHVNNCFQRKEKRGKTIENPPFVKTNWFNHISPFISVNCDDDNQMFTRVKKIGDNQFLSQTRNTTSNTLPFKNCINQSYEY